MDVPKQAFVVLLVLGLLTAGVLDVLFNYEQNLCEMTYMYEYPDYTVMIIKQLRIGFCKSGSLITQIILLFTPVFHMNCSVSL